MIKVLFFSSSSRSLPVLKSLQKNFEVVGVITQPDRPVGRLQKITPTPISIFAHAKKIPILKPESLDEKVFEWISKLKPEVLISSYYGLLIPEKILNFSPTGVLNIHPSLLPTWRGPSPVQAAIINGDKETGITIIKMDEEFDHGPIIWQEKEEIKETDTQETLYKRLFEIAAKILPKVLPEYLEGKIKPRNQDHNRATFTRLVKKEHGYIMPNYLVLAQEGKTANEKWKIPFIKNFTLLPSPFALERFVRAMYPWPGAWTLVRPKSIQSQRLKILKSHIEQPTSNTYRLILDLVQLEGKNPVSWKQFKEGYPKASFD